jgi:hypothetical protein
MKMRIDGNAGTVLDAQIRGPEDPGAVVYADTLAADGVDRHPGPRNPTINVQCPEGTRAVIHPQGDRDVGIECVPKDGNGSDSAPKKPERKKVPVRKDDPEAPIIP